MFTSGALVLAMSVARITVVRLKETPKYLLGTGEDARLMESLNYISQRYNRPCSLTLEQLEACGVVTASHSKSRFSLSETLIHVRGLFATKQMATSTLLVWLSWTLIGLAYPLFYVFLEYVHPFSFALVFLLSTFSLLLSTSSLLSHPTPPLSLFPIWKGSRERGKGPQPNHQENWLG